MDQADSLEALATFSTRAARNFAKLTDPLAGDLEQADLVRYYRDERGRLQGLDHAPDTMVSWQLGRMFLDRAELHALYARTMPSLRDMENALLLAASITLGAVHGMLGGAWAGETALILGGAAGLAALGLDNGAHLAAARGVFKAATSVLVYRLVTSAGTASRSGGVSTAHE